MVEPMFYFNPMTSSTLQFVIVDIETTGGTPKRGQPSPKWPPFCTMAPGKLTDGSNLIHPEAPIPMGITRLTGIDDNYGGRFAAIRGMRPRPAGLLGGTLYLSHTTSALTSATFRLRSKPMDCTTTPAGVCTVRMSP